jgi:hypothetical protein
MKRRFIAACAVAAALSAAATGCTAQNEDAPGAAVHESTGTERRLLSEATQQLVKECMARHGFRYWVVHPLTAEESRPVGYVQDDVAWARRHGYGSRISAKAELARKTNPNGAFRKALPRDRGRAYDTALDGGPSAPVLSVEAPGGGTIRKRVGGCVAESEKRLYGDPRAWFAAEKTATNLRPLYGADLMRDRRFATAVKAWSACMTAKGHPYENPSDARRAAIASGSRQPADTGFAAEREVAVADAVCARENRLRAVGRERESHYVTKLRERYGYRLDTFHQMRRAALARAQKIVAPRS